MMKFITTTTTKTTNLTSLSPVMMMRLLLLLLLLVAISMTATTAQQEQEQQQPKPMNKNKKKKIVLGLSNGGSSFFEPVATGFLERCAELASTPIPTTTTTTIDNDNTIEEEELEELEVDEFIDVECHVRFPPDKVRCDLSRTPVFEEFLYNISVDAIALVPCRNITVIDTLMKQAQNSLKNVPVILMDTDIPNATNRLAYLGTDQFFLGQTMARLLKQLRPEGGTFVIIAPKDGRDEGFLKEITNQNLDSTKAHWYSVSNYVPYPGGGSIGYGNQMLNISEFNDEVTGIVIMRQTPMKHENWTTLVRQIKQKHPNCVFIGTDGADYQLDYLNRRHVDGLVGQLPHEMGTMAAQTMFDYVLTKMIQQEQMGDEYNYKFEPLVPDSISTNVVAYNLIPINLPIANVNENLLYNLSYLGYILFTVTAMTSCTCILWTIYYRSSRVVTAAQPNFLCMVAIGTIILSSCLIPLSMDRSSIELASASNSLVEDYVNMTKLLSDDYTIEDKVLHFSLANMTSHDPNQATTANVAICMSIPWLAFLGFTVVFSALFSKTMRVNTIFNTNGSGTTGTTTTRNSTSTTTRIQRVQVTEQQVLLPFGGLMVSNILVLTLWTILDPLTYSRQENVGTDYWNRAVSTYGGCRSDQTLTYLLPLALLNFICVSTATWQAIRARDIQSEFAEAKYIFLSVAFMLQTFLTGIPMIVIVKDQPEPYYVMMTLMVFLLSMVTLLLIFVPKMKLRYKYAQQSDLEQRKSIKNAIQKSARGGFSSELNFRNGGGDGDGTSSNQLGDGGGGTAAGIHRDAAAAAAAAGSEVGNSALMNDFRMSPEGGPSIINANLSSNHGNIQGSGNDTLSEPKTSSLHKSSSIPEEEEEDQIEEA